MKITGLKIHNFLGIKTFSVTKTGKINLITGSNGAGKSSVVRAIQEALKSSGRNSDLIHLGEEKAEIYLTLDDRIQVERTITPDRTPTLKVVDGDRPVPKPQTWLNELLGFNPFNPIAFFEAQPAIRRELILQAVPFTLDLDLIREIFSDLGMLPLAGMLPATVNWNQHGLLALAEMKQDIYDRRREQNLHVDRLKKSLQLDRREIPQSFDAARFRSFDYQSQMSEYEQAREVIAKHERAEAHLQHLRDRNELLKRQIAELEQKILQLKEERQQVIEEGKKIAEVVESFERPPIEQIRAELDTYQQSQKILNKLEEIEKREQALQQEEKQHKALDDLYKLLAKDVSKAAVQRMALPIPGLEIDGDAITVNGVSIDTMSTSEQMRFAVKIAKALAGELKIICVDGFEALDSESRQAFLSESSGDDFEYFICQVGDGDLALTAHEAAAEKAGVV